MLYGLNHITGKPGPCPNPPRDGDKKQARKRINVEVKTGYGISTFFANDTAVKPDGYDVEVDGYYGIHDVIEWAKTSRGGRQYDMMQLLGHSGCSSQYGICE